MIVIDSIKYVFSDIIILFDIIKALILLNIKEITKPKYYIIFSHDRSLFCLKYFIDFFDIFLTET